MQSVARYTDMVEAAVAARGAPRSNGALSPHWDVHARGYRFDPHRLLEPHVHAAVHLVHQDDTVIDVGGGAGRIGLPVALRAREVINVEPSREMGREFLDLAESASITNVQWLQQDWLQATDMSADVVLTADVAYFITAIESFLLRLHATARRRVIMLLWSVPPPNRDAPLFERVIGNPQPLFPGYRELLEVIWDLGILPDVRVLNELFEWPEQLPDTRDSAVEFALDALDRPGDTALARIIEPQVDVLFEQRDSMFVPAWRHDGRAMLISWAPAEFPGIA